MMLSCKVAGTRDRHATMREWTDYVWAGRDCRDGQMRRRTERAEAPELLYMTVHVGAGGDGYERGLAQAAGSCFPGRAGY